MNTQTQSIDPRAGLPKNRQPEGTLNATPDAPIQLSVTVDNLDAADAPTAPWTLNLAAESVEGRDHYELGDGGGALIGASIPALLRELADLIERGEVTL